MPDLGAALRDLAGRPSELDLPAVHARAVRHRRRRVALVASSAALLVALVVGTTVFTLEGGSSRRPGVFSDPASTSVAPPTTTTLTPAVDLTPAVLAQDPVHQLDPAIPPCTGEQIKFFRSNPSASLSTSGLLLWFSNQAREACALASFPEVEGLTDAGTWQRLPMGYQNLEAVSSTIWTGLVEPDGVGLVARIDTRLPSWYGSACPAPGPTSTTTAAHYSALRLLLRSGAVIDVPTPLDVQPCELVMTRFGDEHQGPIPR